MNPASAALIEKNELIQELLAACKEALGALQMIDSDHSQAECAGHYADNLRAVVKKAEAV